MAKINNIILDNSEGINYQVYYDLNDYSSVTLVRESPKGFHVRHLRDGIVEGPWIDVTEELEAGDCCQVPVHSYWVTETNPVGIKNLQWLINFAHMTPDHVKTRITLNHEPTRDAFLAE